MLRTVLCGDHSRGKLPQVRSREVIERGKDDQTIVKDINANAVFTLTI